MKKVSIFLICVLFASFFALTGCQVAQKNEVYPLGYNQSDYEPKKEQSPLGKQASFVKLENRSGKPIVTLKLNGFSGDIGVALRTKEGKTVAVAYPAFNVNVELEYSDTAYSYPPKNIIVFETAPSPIWPATKSIVDKWYQFPFKK